MMCKIHRLSTLHSMDGSNTSFCLNDDASNRSSPKSFCLHSCNLFLCLIVTPCCPRNGECSLENIVDRSQACLYQVSVQLLINEWVVIFPLIRIKGDKIRQDLTQLKADNLSFSGRDCCSLEGDNCEGRTH